MLWFLVCLSWSPLQSVSLFWHFFPSSLTVLNIPLGWEHFQKPLSFSFPVHGFRFCSLLLLLYHIFSSFFLAHVMPCFSVQHCVLEKQHKNLYRGTVRFALKTENTNQNIASVITRRSCWWEASSQNDQKETWERMIILRSSAPKTVNTNRHYFLHQSPCIRILDFSFTFTFTSSSSPVRASVQVLHCSPMQLHSFSSAALFSLFFESCWAWQCSVSCLSVLWYLFLAVCDYLTLFICHRNEQKIQRSRWQTENQYYQICWDVRSKAESDE